MTLRERAALFLLGVGTKAPLLPLTSTLTTRHVAPDRASFAANVTDGYKKNQVALACIATRAQTLNEPPCVVVDQDGKPVDDHPLTMLFKRPNPYMSQSMFWQYVSTYIDVGGNCYIHKVRNVYGRVLELYPYHDGVITPVASGEWVREYVFEQEGKRTTIPAQDIIHLRSYYIDPLNPIKALSPVRMCGIHIDNYNELNGTLFSYLKNNGAPSGVLSIPVGENITPQGVEALREQMKRNTTGENRGNPLILNNGMTYQQMGLTVTNLETSSQFEQYETAICSIFRVHPAVAMTVAGLRSSTYSNMAAAHEEYTTLTRIPTWNAWEEAVEHSFRAEFPDVNVEFDTSNVAALQADHDKTQAQYTAGILTLNEARAYMGLAPVTGGDTFASAGGSGFLSRNIEAKSLHADEGQIDQSKDTKAEAYWRALDKATRELADDLEPIVVATIGNAEQLAIDTFTKSATKKWGSAEMNSLIRQFMVASGPWRESLVKQIMALAAQSVDADMTQVATYIDRVQERVTREVNEKITESIGTIRARVQEVVAQNSGGSAEAIREALTQQFTTLKESRAKAIATTTARATATRTTTETWSAMNEDETSKENEIVKVWTTKRDGKVRDSHRKLDGRWVTMGKTFNFGEGDESEGPGLADTAGNAVNCRCVLRPVRRKNLR